MKAFARNRNARPADGASRPEETAIGDTPEQANEDFLARLGDLDQFIGAGTADAAGLATPAAPRLPSVSDALRNQTAPVREPLPEVTGDPRRLYASAPETAPAPAEDEAADFLQRLGDLDRFIGGSGPLPTPAPRPTPPTAAAPVAAPIAAPVAAPATPATERTGATCPVCRSDVDPAAPSTVTAVEQLRRADGSIVECPPLAFHPACWTSHVGDFRRIS